jgi:hypothetical protein
MNPYANLQTPDIGGRFMQSFQQGGQMRREQETQNALTQYALDPNNPEVMQGLAKYNPQMAIGLQERKRQEAMRGLEAHRENIVTGAKIFRQLNVRDEATYQQARQMAAQLGMDLTQVPPNYDPKYVQGVVSIADAMDPRKEAQDRYVPLQPGGSLARIGPDGRAEIAIMQNDGSKPIGAPVQQAGQMPQVSDEASYAAVPPGAQYVGPDGQVRVKQGGQTPQASGGFPPFGN